MRVDWRLSAVTLAAFGVTGGLTAPPAEAAEGRRIALIIGISDYEHLPVEVRLDNARSEAADLQRVLEQSGGYAQVRLLTDASATLAHLQSALQDQIANEVGVHDTFMLYFAGQGVGADYGDPRILLYNTDPDALEATSMSLAELDGYIEKYVHCKSYVVVLDAAHPGIVNNLALLGPTGDAWPGKGRSAFVVSAAGPKQTGKPGVFAGAFLDGIAGRADSNGDGSITASELNNYLVKVVPQASSGTQTPTVVASYDPTLIVAQAPLAAGSVAAPVDALHAPPRGRVDKAKFIFAGGTRQSVQCTDGVPTACDPACYVWDIPAGDCTVSMTVNGQDLTGSTSVLYRGAYTCGVYEGGLRCSTPPPP